MRRATAAIISTALALGAAAVGHVAADARPVVSRPVAAAETDAPRSVMYVGNNWAGTANVIDARTFSKVGRINVVPDYAERMAEIRSDPQRLAYFLVIREQIGEGHDQLVDDMFSTPDGTILAVSRPSFADVVGIDLRTRKIVWRFKMHGQRSDHMAVNPKGTRLLVSDSTVGHVDELDLRTGKPLRQFASGETPHESNYSKDGSRIFHASIGKIYTPTDPSMTCPQPDPSKGDQRFEIVDNSTFQILHQWDIGKKLAEAGFPCMASAVRPMALSPDERTAYLQISFFHGYVAFDLVHGRVTQVVPLPQSEAARQTPKAKYVLNSAHHGLAISRDGSRLCVAGTMDDYVGLVDVANPARQRILRLPHEGDRPYWATNGPGGGRCWVSIAGDDRVNVYSYATRKRVATLTVGDHPQRVRPGVVSQAAQAAWRSGASRFAAPETSTTSPLPVPLP
jgi:WD40 repeat protein